MEEQWDKVQTDVWVPEKEEDEISGIYLGVQKEVGENKSNLYTIEVEEGKTMAFWGSKVLDGKMLALKVGQQVKILFLGKVKPEKGREYKGYDVFVKKTKPIPNTAGPIETQKF